MEEHVPDLYKTLTLIPGITRSPPSPPALHCIIVALKPYDYLSLHSSLVKILNY